jgi:TrpR-related protein YerC/YecD
MKISKPIKNKFYETLLKIDTLKECEDLCDDLFTIQEIEQFSQRVEAAEMLMDGKTYQEIIDKTNISSTTLSRVSRCVKYGKGYKSIIKKEIK